MPNIVRSVSRLVDQDDVQGLLSALVDGYSLAYDAGSGAFVLRPWMTSDVVPGGFAVPAAHTCIYNNMSVPGGVTVEVAGLLVDPSPSTEPLERVPAPAEGAFSVVFLPDTQTYTRRWGLSQIWREQTAWIRDNQTRLNIAYVMHVGDVIYVSSHADEWADGDAAMCLLDVANIPYGIAIGNHDYNNISNRNAALFNFHFSQSRYTTKSWWSGGFFGTGAENSYNIRAIGGRLYGFMTLEFFPRDSVVTWATGILAANPNVEFIISTHAFIDHNGVLYVPGMEWSIEDYGTIRANSADGAELYAALMAYDNVIWLQCGHDLNGTTARFSGHSRRGALFNAMMSDWQNYQGLPLYGSGYLCVAQFDPTRRMVSMYSYSPTLGLLSGNPNQFTTRY